MCIHIHIHNVHSIHQYKPLIPVKGPTKPVFHRSSCGFFPGAKATDLEARKRATTVYLVSRMHRVNDGRRI